MRFFDARGDHDRLRERTARPSRDLGRDRIEVGGEARAVDVVEQLPQVDVLLEGELALDRALAKLLHLGAELLGLRAGGEQAVRPAVHVAERLRDALETHRERPQRRRPGRLHTAQRPRVVRPERERDEDERREDEQADDEPTTKWPVTTGIRRGETPDCQAQRRRSRAALPGHGEAV